MNIHWRGFLHFPSSSYGRHCRETSIPFLFPVGYT